MGRQRKVSDVEVTNIRGKFSAGEGGKSISKEFGISLLTAYKIKNHQGAYADLQPEGSGPRPILNAAGEVIGLSEEDPMESTPEGSQT